MRVVGAVTAVALAHENISPWQVLWWVLCGTVVLTGVAVIVVMLRRWWRTRVQPRWQPSAVAVIVVGVVLLVWGTWAGYADWSLLA